MSYHRNFPAHQRTDETEQAKPEKQPQRKPAPKLPSKASRELHTLADPKASDGDKLKAWLRLGLDIGAIELRHVERLGVVTR